MAFQVPQELEDRASNILEEIVWSVAQPWNLRGTRTSLSSPLPLCKAALHRLTGLILAA